MFNVYEEPLFFDILITLFSVTTNYLVWFFGLSILKVSLSFQKKNLPLSVVYLVPALISIANHYGYVLNIIPITAFYLFLSIYSYFAITRKSLRWINISTALFILFVTATYNYFAFKVHSFSFIFFNYNDLLQYDIWVRPYFDIYTPGERLSETMFKLSGTPLTIFNTNTEHRVYTFFYLLHTIVFLVWYWIYRDVLNKHNYDFNSGAQEKDLKIIS